MIEVDKGLSAPEPIAQILPANDLAWVVKEHRQNLKCLLRQPNLHTSFA